jgi:hypothetical protein
MRNLCLFALMITAACGSDGDDLVACDATWQLNTSCEKRCEIRPSPAATDRNCVFRQHDEVVGVCDQDAVLLEIDGTLGCCAPNHDGKGDPAIRWYACHDSL